MVKGAAMHAATVNAKFKCWYVLSYKEQVKKKGEEIKKYAHFLNECAFIYSDLCDPTAPSLRLWRTT